MDIKEKKKNRRQVDKLLWFSRLPFLFLIVFLISKL